MGSTEFDLGIDRIDIAAWRRVVREHGGVRLGAPASATMARHRARLEQLLASGAVIYGVNTGYGARSGSRLPDAVIETAQRNTVLSHAVGTGDSVPEAVARGTLLLKGHELAKGFSAVRPQLAASVAACLRAGIAPVIPALGSVSASGDLVPNAHVGLLLLGIGPALTADGQVGAAEVLASNGLAPVSLAAKEGLALVNGTAFSTSLAMETAIAALELLGLAAGSTALSLQMLAGVPSAFDARIVRLRPHPGAVAFAAGVRELLDGGPAWESPRLQDGYSLRAAPQVHGTSLGQVAMAAQTVLVEANSWTDNPAILEDGTYLSGGNFHAEPVAQVMDALCVAVAAVSSLSAQRIVKLLDAPPSTGLPSGLVAGEDPDVSLGLRMLTTVAAALTSECRALSHPASVDTFVIDSAEDHVSMAAIAARKAMEVVRLARTVIAIELLAGAQAVDVGGRARLSPGTRSLYDAVRSLSDSVRRDRPLTADIAAVTDELGRGGAGRFGTAAERYLTDLSWASGPGLALGTHYHRATEGEEDTR